MSDKQFNVIRRRGTATFPADDTTVVVTTTETNINGLHRWIEWETPNLEGTDSTKIEVRSPSGGTFFDSGTVAESTRFTQGTVFPLPGIVDVVITVEGTQSVSSDITYDIYFTE